MTIYPTGSCFDDAMDFIEAEYKRDFVNAEKMQFYLVHGICLDDKGEPFSHAWVESGEIVTDSGFLLNETKIQFTAPKVEYYEKFQVQKYTRYSVDEMQAMNHKYETYGPWELEYIKLCKNYDPKKHDRMFI